MLKAEKMHTFTADPTRYVVDFYSRLYRVDKSDSPEQSRTSLLRRSRPHIFSLTPRESMLDLGAGRQVFERQLIAAYGTPKCPIVTVDIANIPAEKLLMKDRENIFHIRADGSELPFENGSFSLAVSNMALDLMPKKAFTELYRVLKSGAHSILNLHHPFLIPDNIDEMMLSPKLGKSEKSILDFWEYLRINDVLFRNPDEIINSLSNIGFQVEKAKQATDLNDKWWEVDLVKK